MKRKRIFSQISLQLHEQSSGSSFPRLLYSFQLSTSITFRLLSSKTQCFWLWLLVLNFCFTSDLYLLELFRMEGNDLNNLSSWSRGEIIGAFSDVLRSESESTEFWIWGSSNNQNTLRIINKGALFLDYGHFRKNLVREVPSIVFVHIRIISIIFKD